MPKIVLSLLQCQPRIPELRFREPVSWTIRDGETWAVVGPNGAGKSTLANLIAGKSAIGSGHIDYAFLAADEKAWKAIQLLSFDSVYGLADFRQTYYQQRWHSKENDEMPSVGELLGETADPEILELFHVDAFSAKKINFLSSGELRKFLITKALLDQPKLLIIDNPYIGLDAGSREVLRDALQKLNGYGKTRVLFLLSDPADIPDFVTHVLPMEQMQVGTPQSRAEYRENHQLQALPSYLIEPDNGQSGKPIVKLNHITIRYGEKTVLGGIDWQINRGEKWVLTGPNGSGKSTLLSLINADHPQAYANDISFFGRKRGAGQSIWEVKKRIGYVSPEMHTHYYQNIPALDVVGSGLYDTIGTVHRCNEEQTARSLAWMERLGIAELCNRSFIKLSSGEQRLVLLARAFVKEPELLILDEPLHGLDVANKIRVRDLIDEYAHGNNVTLIYVTHYLNEIPPCINRHFTLA